MGFVPLQGTFGRVPTPVATRPQFELDDRNREVRKEAPVRPSTRRTVGRTRRLVWSQENAEALSTGHTRAVNREVCSDMTAEAIERSRIGRPSKESATGCRSGRIPLVVHLPTEAVMHARTSSRKRCGEPQR